MTKDWRQKVLESIQAPYSLITIAHDPDLLLQDEGIVCELQERGIEIADFQDRAVFRYWYESRNRLSGGGRHVLIRLQAGAVEDIPYDVWVQGHHVSLSKSALFPSLSAAVVRELDWHTMDALSSLEDIPVRRSDAETIDFVLKRIYKLTYDTVDTAAELLLLCIARHQLPFRMPEAAERHLSEALGRKALLVPRVDIARLFGSSDACFAFLQEEWHSFLAGGTPEGHAFWNPSLQNALAGLFRMGTLVPVRVETAGLPDALLFGVLRDEAFARRISIDEHISRIDKLLEQKTDRRGWIEIVRLFGRAKTSLFELGFEDGHSAYSPQRAVCMTAADQPHARLKALEQSIEAKFAVWLDAHYGALASLSDRHAPVMLHQAAEYVHLQGSPKKAIIVIDGMSFVQWSQIRSYLQSFFDFMENGVFAWIPTLTSVSRQAIFTGEMPRAYGETIHTTAGEEKAWKACWARYGAAPIHVTYEKSLGQGEYDRAEIKALAKPSIKAAGLVVDMIDKLTHNTIQGQLGMYSQIAIWLRGGYLQALLRDLLDAGFDVYITSDHGNKESVGIGAVREGVLADTRGERVRIYRSRELRDRAAGMYPSRSWKDAGLPDAFHVLIANYGEAYVKEGEAVVSHGGASIEEVIVPFVRVNKRAE